MLAIGAAAGAASFTHVHAVAVAHGQGGWLTWADAVVLELMSIASGLELRRRRRHSYPVTLPAVVLVCAVVLSLAAQVVEAEPSPIGWIAAALPALGFLTMVKIALGHSGGHTMASDDRRHRSRAVLGAGDDPGDGSQAASATSSRVGEPRPVGTPARQDRDGTVQDPGIVPDGPGRPLGYAAAPDDGMCLQSRASELLPAARAARATLLATGRRVSRDALAGQLRADGYPAANAVISAVHRALSADAAPKGPDGLDPMECPPSGGRIFDLHELGEEEQLAAESRD